LHSCGGRNTVKTVTSGEKTKAHEEHHITQGKKKKGIGKENVSEQQGIKNHRSATQGPVGIGKGDLHGHKKGGEGKKDLC